MNTGWGNWKYYHFIRFCNQFTLASMHAYKMTSFKFIQFSSILDVNSHFIFISFFLSTRVSSYVMRNKNKSHQYTRTHSHICRCLTFLLFLISVKIFEQTGKIDKKWDTKRLWTRTSRDFWFFSRNIFKSCHRRRCRCQCLTSFNLIFRRVSRKHLLRRNIFFLFSCTTHRWTG